MLEGLIPSISLPSHSRRRMQHAHVRTSLDQCHFPETIASQLRALCCRGSHTYSTTKHLDQRQTCDICVVPRRKALSPKPCFESFVSASCGRRQGAFCPRQAPQGGEPASLLANLHWLGRTVVDAFKVIHTNCILQSSLHCSTSCVCIA